MENLTLLTFFCSLFILSIMEFSFASDIITPMQSISDGNTLISSNQTFELGFFSPGNSKNRYLGIWYKNSPEIVVWVANRNEPIGNATGVLTISNNGSLVLLNQTKSVIWSSNTSRVADDPVAQLLDSGNLVLKTSVTAESYLWQSFDYPSDTFLPGMKLGWDLKTGLERYLTSWRSADDPSPGNFTCRLEIHGLPELVIKMGSVKRFLFGPWNGIYFGSVPIWPSSIFESILVRNEDEVYYMYEPINNPSLTRLTLFQSGLLQRFIWNGRRTEWSIVQSVPTTACDTYGQCSPNGICSNNKMPICECLKGYTAKSQEGDTNKLFWSKQCVKKLPSDCQSGEGFLKLVGMKLPDMLEFWLNESMSLKECEAACLKNCSCTAYANSNLIGQGSGCLMWFGDLIDIRVPPEEYRGQDIYIRVPASELELNQNTSEKKRLTILVASTISGIIILGLIFCIIWKKRKKNGLESKGEDIQFPLFDLATIASATNNFSEANIIGVGGFGPVYKANLSTGQEIAVKRLSKSSGQGVEEFRSEVILIAKLQHRNLVGLLGSCIHGGERMLIYEYMPNKSLDGFLFDLNVRFTRVLLHAYHKRSTSLGWKKRFDIVMGIVRGLLYLHQDSKLHIIHRDLKASNILLDINLYPKISDFGLARIFGGDNEEAKTRRIVGTYGYMSPEYAIDGRFSVKSDIFSLGVLLLEIVSGKKNRGFYHQDHHHSLLGHAWLLWNEDRALELMDTCLKDSCIEYQVLRCIQVGLLCVQKYPKDRPAISSVVSMLANEVVALPQPKEPGFFIERCSTNMDAPSSKELHTNNTVTLTRLDGR